MVTRYRNKIIIQPFLLYADTICNTFHFMVENAFPHRPQLEDDILQREDITWMPWSGSLLDVSPIKHVRDVREMQCGQAHTFH